MENEKIKIWVDELYEKRDREAHEIMHRIAQLAVEQVIEKTATLAQ